MTTNDNELNDDVEAAREAFLAAAAEKEAAASEEPAPAEPDDDATDYDLEDLTEEAAEAELDEDDEEDTEGEPRAALKPSAQKVTNRVDETDDGDDTPDIELDDEIEWAYLDPDTADALKKIKRGYDDVVKALRSELEGMKEVVAEQFNIAAEQRFQGYVAAQPQRYSKLLAEPSAQRTLREEMDVLRDGFRSRGKEVPAEDVLFSKALNSAFADEIKKIDADSTKRSVRARQSQMTIPPSARRASPDRPLTDEEIARENLIAEFERKAKGS